MARSTDHGRSIAQNLKVDDDTCVCCRTAVATSADGVVYVAWRKIFDGNIRETVVSRSMDDGQTFSPSCRRRQRSVGVSCLSASSGVSRCRSDKGDCMSSGTRRAPTRCPQCIWPTPMIRGRHFPGKMQLNRSKGTFPDHPQMAVDPAGRIAVIWEEQSPVRREVVVSYSLDRGRSFNDADQTEREKRTDADDGGQSAWNGRDGVEGTCDAGASPGDPNHAVSDGELAMSDRTEGHGPVKPAPLLVRSVASGVCDPFGAGDTFRTCCAIAESDPFAALGRHKSHGRCLRSQHLI